MKANRLHPDRSSAGAVVATRSTCVNRPTGSVSIHMANAWPIAMPADSTRQAMAKVASQLCRSIRRTAHVRVQGVQESSRTRRDTDERIPFSKGGRHLERTRQRGNQPTQEILHAFREATLADVADRTSVTVLLTDHGCHHLRHFGLPLRCAGLVRIRQRNPPGCTPPSASNCFLIAIPPQVDE